MTKITIQKQGEEITYRRTETTFTFLVNGKEVKVYFHEDYDEMQGCDYDAEEEDIAKLTDEEHEIFGEDLHEYAQMKDGEKVEVDGWED